MKNQDGKSEVRRVVAIKGKKAKSKEVSERLYHNVSPRALKAQGQ